MMHLETERRAIAAAAAKQAAKKSGISTDRIFDPEEGDSVSVQIWYENGYGKGPGEVTHVSRDGIVVTASFEHNWQESITFSPLLDSHGNTKVEYSSSYFRAGDRATIVVTGRRRR